MPATRGERGPKGDHGQEGETGSEGARGRPGETGPRGVLSTGQGLALFLVLVVALIVLTYRSEIQQRTIEESTRTTAAAVYQQCLVSAGNAKSLDAVLDTIILRLREQPATPERDAGIVLYENAKPRLPDCGQEP